MIALILAGGSGTRFWPVSREAEPKQFLPLLGAGSLLADTVARILPLVPAERILIVTGRSFTERARREAPMLPAENVIGEPAGRNTAPAIALAAARAELVAGAGEVMAVLPADHAIGDIARFHETLRAGEEFCLSEKVLLTLGVRPTRPETGYGYLEIGERRARARGLDVHAVERFVEKPDREDAERYAASGRHLWNSGMFLWRVDAIADALRAHVPGASDALEAFREAAATDLYGVLEEYYPRLPALSIDYAVMEKASNVAAIPADFAWNDVGSWSALGELLARDREGNEVVGRHVGLGTRRSVIHAGSRLVATIGLDGFVVVETDRAVLVCPRDRAQDVRDLVRKLRDLGLEEDL
ncbi:MAG: sugar phosphate nucleotidyltransferase [Candidatus Eisenbacteria bacterium]